MPEEAGRWSMTTPGMAGGSAASRIPILALTGLNRYTSARQPKHWRSFWYAGTFIFRLTAGFRPIDRVITGGRRMMLPSSPAFGRSTPPGRRGHGSFGRFALMVNHRHRSEERRVGKECRFRW